MRITHDLIESVATNRVGWNRRQLELLGVSWPPKKGWRSRLIGSEIPDNVWGVVVSLKGITRRRKK